MAFVHLKLSYSKDLTKECVNPIYEEDDEDEELYQTLRSPGEYFHDDYLKSSRMDTIYESYEEFVDSSDEPSNEASSSDGTSSARVSADSPSSLLRRSIRAWCEATGLPTSIVVETKERSFRLHKFPLVSRSGYFKRILSGSTHVKLPDDFPGGSEVFEVVANFCYDTSSVDITTSTVALLRCSAGFLEMTEDFGRGNLSERTESYLKHVVFPSWENTIQVLRDCERLVPISEELLIVTRCIDSLAATVCCEVQRPRQTPDRRTRAYVVKDMLTIHFGLFDRLVLTLRKQGLEEEPISELIMEYLKGNLLEGGRDSDDADEERLCLLEAVVRLLPLDRFLVPLKFLFKLHGCALAWGASRECMHQLETSLASQLELASSEDLLLSLESARKGKVIRAHAESLLQVVSVFMSQQQIILDCSEMLLADSELRSASSYTSLAVSAVTRVWDEYLTEIASYGELSPRRFSELAEVIPSHVRVSHDQLYKAIHVFFKFHVDLSQSERLLVCRGLNCQKLSRELCMHAVQNELMPLRMIVQAMFMQQLQSRNESSGSSSERVSSFHRRTPSANCQTFEEQLGRKADDGLPLGVILQRDAAYREAVVLKDDFEATKARLRELEQELFRMKRTMKDADRERFDVSNNSERELTSGKFRRRLSGTCMCHLWSAQASGIRFGNRITKTFQKMGLGSFWKGKASSSRTGVIGMNMETVGCNNNVHVPSESRGGNWVKEQREELTGCATPLRVHSLRRGEAESKTRRHVRHHSFS